MRKILDRITSLLTNQKKEVPLLYITFDYNKFIAEGKQGSCMCSSHPALAKDEHLRNMLHEVVDYIRDNYNMVELTNV